MLATAAPQSPYMEPDNLWAERGCWWVVVIPEQRNMETRGRGMCQDPEVAV